MIRQKMNSQFKFRQAYTGNLELLGGFSKCPIYSFAAAF